MITLRDTEPIFLFLLGVTAAFAARWVWAEIAAAIDRNNPYFPQSKDR